MANSVRLFESESGYSGGYTSKILHPTGYRASLSRRETPLFTRGVVQVMINSGQVTLEARLSNDAPWLPLKTWSEDSIEELVLAFQLRVVVTDEAKVWLGEYV